MNRHAPLIAFLLVISAVTASAAPDRPQVPTVNEQVVIREFATACVTGSIGGQFIELEAPTTQTFQGSMRLVARNRNGVTVLNVINLFTGQTDGTPWPAGRSWLLGSTALAASAGVSPDRFIAASLDSVKGSIELYGGPDGATLVDRIDYGSGAPVAAPPHGYSVETQPDGSVALDGSPSPTKFTGASGAGSACYCPGPNCADESFARLRIDEVALHCANGETTTQFVELRALGADQEFRSAARLRASGHDGAVLFDIGDLFPGQVEGAAWAAGTTWLLAAGEFAKTELFDASGVQPDAYLHWTLDPAGGSLVLYDGRLGGATLHVVNYGPGGTIAAPGRGESLQRGPGDVMSIVSQQEPENHAGSHTPVTRCPCGTSALQLASSPYDYSTLAMRDTSNVNSAVGYDLRAGSTHVAIGDRSSNGCGARMADVYTVQGPTPGEEVTFSATLHVAGDILVNCNFYHCSTAGGQAALLWNGTQTSASLGADADVLLSLPLSVRVGDPWHLDWILEAYVNSEGPPADAHYGAQLVFADVPAGMTITSCSGFRFDGPTATVPSLANTRSDAEGVHLEWYTPRVLPNVVVERTDGSEAWQVIGVPTTRTAQLLIYDDPTARAGARYGYRLTWNEGLESRSTDIAWVDVPGDALALRALSANPSPGAPVLEYVLPVAGPVRIEFTDLRGRRVWNRDLGMQPAGRHRLESGRGTALAPGIYWARLIRPEGQVLLKLIVLGR